MVQACCMSAVHVCCMHAPRVSHACIDTVRMLHVRCTYPVHTPHACWLQLLYAPCIDVEPSAPIFSQLVEMLPQIIAMKAEKHGLAVSGLPALTLLFAKELKAHGCKALLKEEFHGDVAHFCETTHGPVAQKSGIIFCPKTCKCTRNQNGCPRTCPDPLLGDVQSVPTGTPVPTIQQL